MSRHFVAFGLLALAGMLILPEPVEAAGGIRGGARVHFRAPLMLKAHPRPRAGILRAGRTIALPSAVALPLPAKPKLHPGPVRTTLAAPWSRLHRLHHRRHLTGWIYPVTVGEDAAYIGVPYGPAETIPVYGPQSSADAADPSPPRMAPRLTNVPAENQDACRSERVTVPAAEGEREITVVRC
jgi:hypothetical protein